LKRNFFASFRCARNFFSPHESLLFLVFVRFRCRQILGFCHFEFVDLHLNKNDNRKFISVTNTSSHSCFLRFLNFLVFAFASRTFRAIPLTISFYLSSFSSFYLSVRLVNLIRTPFPPPFFFLNTQFGKIRNKFSSNPLSQSAPHRSDNLGQQHPTDSPALE